MMTCCHPLLLEGKGVWFEDAELGLGLWQGEYQGINHLWLRWYNRDQQWIPTPTEQESQRAERLAAQLRALGVEPET
jgi:hypothetical protein